MKHNVIDTNLNKLYRHGEAGPHQGTEVVHLKCPELGEITLLRFLSREGVLKYSIHQGERTLGTFDSSDEIIWLFNQAAHENTPNCLEVAKLIGSFTLDQRSVGY